MRERDRDVRGNNGEYEADELPNRTARKKQDKHNGLVERIFKIEEHEAVTDEEIKVINHRIKDLEGKTE